MRTVTQVQSFNVSRWQVVTFVNKKTLRKPLKYLGYFDSALRQIVEKYVSLALRRMSYYQVKPGLNGSESSLTYWIVEGNNSDDRPLAEILLEEATNQLKYAPP